MKGFIEIETSSQVATIAISTIAAVTKEGEGCVISFTTPVLPLDSVNNQIRLKTPYDEIIERMEAAVLPHQ